MDRLGIGAARLAGTYLGSRIKDGKLTEDARDNFAERLSLGELSSGQSDYL